MRSISKQTVLYHLIYDFSTSVSQTQRDFNILSFIGMNIEDSVIENFVFLATVFYCVDRNSQVTVHTAKYYYNKFAKGLPGFPNDYCYTLVENPESSLGLKSTYKPKYWKVIQKSLKRIGLIESFHHIYLLIIDLISFLWLIIAFDDWTSAEGSVSLVAFYTPIGINTSTGYIFTLIIHVVLTFLCYYFQIALSSFGLYFLNLIWFLYTIIIIFFVVRSGTVGTPVSAILYFIIRYIYHLILSHKCRTGTSFVSFKTPDFKKDSKYMKFSNLFLRYFPFAFELQTLLSWMSKRTKVSFSDYLAVCDIRTHLELLIIEKENKPKKAKQYHTKTRILFGLVLILISVIVAFIPLFFIIGTSPPIIPNKILSVWLEVGFQSLGPVFTSDALIRVVNSDEQQSIADSGHKKLHTLRYASPDTITLLEFRNRSLTAYGNLPDLDQFLTNPDIPKTPYLMITINTESSTTDDQTNSIQNLITFENLNQEQISNFLLELNSDAITTSEINIGLKVPLALFIPIYDDVISLDDVTLSFSLVLNRTNGSNFFSLHPGSGFDSVRLLNPDSDFHNFKIMVWVQSVPKDGVSTLDRVSKSGSIIGTYILLLLIAAVIVRNMSFSPAQNLWFSRIKEPQKLYHMCLAIDAFRTAKDIDKEKDMTEQLLETFRSRENVIRLTEE